MIQLKIVVAMIAGAVILSTLVIGGAVLTSQQVALEKQQIAHETLLPTSVWPEPSVRPADLERAGFISPDLINEKTDFTRKVITLAPGASRAVAKQVVIAAGGTVIGEAGTTGLVVSLPADNLAEAEAKIAESSAVQNVETDFAVGLLANPDWGVARVKAPEVWETVSGNGVAIAILDTGVDRNHPELSGAYIGGYDFFNNDNDPQDDHGHGTAVAGIAVSRKNGHGTIGVSKNASLLAGKVLDSNGVGYISTVVAGIDWAVAQGARVINLSLGTTYDSETLKAAVDRAGARGVIVVAAAGNNGGGSLLYPAAYNSVIAVGATDRSDALASFSALGSELVAPGVNVSAPWLGGGYVSISGTSASAPHISALAALLIEHGTSNVRQALRDGAVDLGAPGPDSFFGYGLPEAPAALALKTDDTTTPTVSFVTPRDGQKIAGQTEIRVNATDDRGVIKVDLITNTGVVLSASAVSPYRWRWNIQDTPAGVYTIIARAFDEAGNVGEDRVTVEVVTQTSGSREQQKQENVLSSPKPTPTVSAQPVISPRPAPRPSSGTNNQESVLNEEPVGTSNSEGGGPPSATIERIPPQAKQPGRP